MSSPAPRPSGGGGTANANSSSAVRFEAPQLAPARTSAGIAQRKAAAAASASNNSNTNATSTTSARGTGSTPLPPSTPPPSQQQQQTGALDSPSSPTAAAGREKSIPSSVGGNSKIRFAPTSNISTEKLEQMRAEARDLFQRGDEDTADAIDAICDSNGWSRDDFIQNRHTFQSLEIFLAVFPTIPFIKHFPNLTQLRVMHAALKEINMDDFKYLVNLEVLWLSENSLTTVKNGPFVKGCPKLKELYVHNNNFTSLEPFLHLQHLEVLVISRNRITSLEGMETLPKLRSLYAPSNGISRIRGTLEKNYELEELNLAGNKIASFREIPCLNALPKLAKLFFADPTYGDNPITTMNNYQTFTLCNVKSVNYLDFVIITPEQRAVAETSYAKKRIFYSMRLQSTERMLGFLKDEAFKLIAAPLRESEASIVRLSNAIAEWEHELFRQGRYQNYEINIGVADRTQSVAVVTNSLQKLKKALALRREEALLYRRSFLMVSKDMENAQRAMMGRMLLELDTGGNVRLEDGRPKDAWYQSCCELIKSRFFVNDFQHLGLGVTDIKVSKVTRIHNHALRTQFDRELIKAVDISDPSYKKLIEYLFFVLPLHGCSEVESEADTVASIVEHGFKQHVMNVEQQGLGYVPLTNSLYLADQIRLMEVSKAIKGGSLTQPTSPSTPTTAATADGSNSSTTTSTPTSIDHIRNMPVGKVIVAKVFLYRQGVERSVLPMSYDVPLLRVKPLDRSQHGVDSLCVPRSRSDDPKQRIWFLFEDAFALPEYIIDYTYGVNNAALNSTLTSASSAVASTSSAGAVAPTSPPTASPFISIPKPAIAEWPTTRNEEMADQLRRIFSNASPPPPAPSTTANNANISRSLSSVPSVPPLHMNDLADMKAMAPHWLSFKDGLSERGIAVDSYGGGGTAPLSSSASASSSSTLPITSAPTFIFDGAAGIGGGGDGGLRSTCTSVRDIAAKAKAAAESAFETLPVNRNLGGGGGEAGGNSRKHNAFNYGLAAATGGLPPTTSSLAAATSGLGANANLNLSNSASHTLAGGSGNGGGSANDTFHHNSDDGLNYDASSLPVEMITAGSIGAEGSAEENANFSSFRNGVVASTAAAAYFNVSLTPDHVGAQLLLCGGGGGGGGKGGAVDALNFASCRIGFISFNLEVPTDLAAKLANITKLDLRNNGLAMRVGEWRVLAASSFVAPSSSSSAAASGGSSGAVKGHLPNLTHLYLSENRIAGLPTLPSSSSNSSSNKADGSAAGPLPVFSSLKHLDLSRNMIVDASSLAALKVMFPMLESLDVTGNIGGLGGVGAALMSINGTANSNATTTTNNTTAAAVIPTNTTAAAVVIPSSSANSLLGHSSEKTVVAFGPPSSSYRYALQSAESFLNWVPYLACVAAPRSLRTINGFSIAALTGIANATTTMAVSETASPSSSAPTLPSPYPMISDGIHEILNAPLYLTVPLAAAVLRRVAYLVHNGLFPFMTATAALSSSTSQLNTTDTSTPTSAAAPSSPAANGSSSRTGGNTSTTTNPSASTLVGSNTSLSVLSNPTAVPVISDAVGALDFLSMRNVFDIALRAVIAEQSRTKPKKRLSLPAGKGGKGTTSAADGNNTSGDAATTTASASSVETAESLLAACPLYPSMKGLAKGFLLPSEQQLAGDASFQYPTNCWDHPTRYAKKTNTNNSSGGASAIASANEAVVTQLRYLSLNNAMTSVFPSTLLTMAAEHLTHLELENHHFTTIDGPVIRSLVNAESISFRHNFIKSIPIDSFSHLPRLTRLDMGYNQLRDVGDLFTSGLKCANLACAIFDNNFLKSVAPFSLIDNLKELYVSNNLIASEKDVNALRDVAKLIILDLSGNPCCNAGGGDNSLPNSGPASPTSPNNNALAYPPLNNYRAYIVFHLRKLKVLDGIPIDVMEATQARDIFAGRVSAELLNERIASAAVTNNNNSKTSSASAAASSLAPSPAPSVANWSAVTELNLSSCGLKEILLLEEFTSLQHLRLEHNLLQSIDGLKCCSKLVSLNLADNKIGDSPVGPRALNFITQLESLSLEANLITSLLALGLNLPKLKFLNLKANGLVKVDGTEGLMGVREILLDANKLRTLDREALLHMANLRHLHCNNNAIKALEGTPLVLRYLTHASFESNRLGDIQDALRSFEGSPLVSLSLLGNAVIRKPLYRNGMIHAMPCLKHLDGKDVTPEERERVEMTYFNANLGAGVGVNNGENVVNGMYVPPSNPQPLMVVGSQQQQQQRLSGPISLGAAPQVGGGGAGGGNGNGGVGDMGMMVVGSRAVPPPTSAPSGGTGGLRLGVAGGGGGSGGLGVAGGSNAVGTTAGTRSGSAEPRGSGGISSVAPRTIRIAAPTLQSNRPLARK